MKRAREFWRIVVGILKEISDESAYERHLRAHGRAHSPEVFVRALARFPLPTAPARSANKPRSDTAPAWAKKSRHGNDGTTRRPKFESW
jgi:hypothetical protein